MNINDYLLQQRKLNDPMPIAKRITCRDGFSLSVQANRTAYCSPRNNEGPWEKVEVGFPSSVPEGIMGYAETASDPTGTVYGYVPIELVEALIDKHGGAEEQKS